MRVQERGEVVIQCTPQVQGPRRCRARGGWACAQDLGSEQAGSLLGAGAPSAQGVPADLV